MDDDKVVRIAHIRKRENGIQEQSLQEHLEHVAALCKKNAIAVNMCALSELIGLMHDMGKATEVFLQYLRHWIEEAENAKIAHHNHAPTGAIYAYERWFLPADGSTEEGKIKQYTAQIIALCIYGHHTGLMDCVGVEADFEKKMKQDKQKLHYQEAVTYFLETICGEQRLDKLFEAACEEVRQFRMIRTSSFSMGLLTRLLLSILIDADRWDSACFEYGRDPLEEPQSERPWNALQNTYEDYAHRTFQGKGALDQKRQEISDRCVAQAEGNTGIYRMSVPTGGGKTFASLRFALKHAEANNLNRIFYIIPYNTILDQNAQDIREALNQYDGILEHHSNVMIEEDDDGRERIRYKRLTERWDSDIILTSMVQFLNALFRAENSNARRMHRLTNAVLIFDEIQALPRNCKILFERAISFLTMQCHSTVVLCTATQLELNLPVSPVELMGDAASIHELHRALQRVTYCPQIDPVMDNEEASHRLYELVDDKQSVLLIVNTKKVAWDMYERTRNALRDTGYELVSIEAGVPDEEITTRAQQSTEKQILCVHLSTLLCPAHRKEYIRWICHWTKAGGRTLCVSTALIEAGINVSFPIVVRSLAGLPSVIQAAGRCNRNCEWETGKVYLWELAEERLGMLEQIAKGKDITRGLVHGCADNYDALGAPEMISEYFQQEQTEYTGKVQKYPLDKSGRSIVGLLSKNEQRNGIKYAIPMRQAFREAGKRFHAIPDETKPVLVPYGEGKNVIAALREPHTMEEEIRLLRKAQSYCVNVYDNQFRQLEEQDALERLGDSGVVALEEGYYDGEAGVYI